ncbi:Adenosylmethionine-8-amino-7-oxononanoate aminotransferase [Hyphomicrobiales bacterium]|nr:Adenosylmethionine-8-amino-7-oxononanoate aminotransferase [Hyphomicrobiales bacterium]CAH1690795.1 Adenosylmethionine-8-amino-7-oxononanoate aminotransferase [Hyphomicrobiales bacterium]
MSNIFHRSAKSVPPMASHASGCTIVDQSGKRYLDACGGAAVSCIGHGDQDVVAAIREQAEKLAYAHTSFFTTDAAEELAAYLSTSTESRLPKVYFTSGGSEAAETALKMAHSYHRERGQPGRTHIIARRQSYHGNTVGALSTGGNMWRRTAYEALMLPGISHIDPCFYYRYAAPDESPEAYGRRMAVQLAEEIERIGADNVSCFIAETVVGATSGCVAAEEGYFKAIRAICDRHGVLLILDEVMCGMGRTGTLHAFEQEGIVPDILIIAKGLGAGYIPLGAVMCRDFVFEAFHKGSGAFIHGHTFVGHPVACAAALATQNVIREKNLVDASARQGRVLLERLAEVFRSHSHVGDIRGRGLFIGLELVEDRATNVPFAPDVQLNARVKRAAMDIGLLIYPGGGTIDGRLGDHILLAPHYILTEDEIETIVARLAVAMDEAITSARQQTSLSES